MIAYLISAGIAVLACLAPLAWGFGEEDPLAVVVILALLLGAGAGVVVAQDLGRCRRWAYITGIVLVSLLSPLWILGAISGFVEIAQHAGQLKAPGWFLFILCLFAVPLSAAIWVLSFLKPVRGWIAAGRDPRDHGV